MKAKPENPPIHPCLINEIIGDYEQGPQIGRQIEHHGMTLRDYFAALALNGILANQGHSDNPSVAVKDAFLYADEALEFRGEE